MTDALTGLLTLTQALRTVLLMGAVALAAIATLDWAVRTRRINPFGGIARFMRAQVEPRLAGIERQVLRAGGRPASTPWWALVAYVVVGALILAVADLLMSLVQQAHVASTLGGAGLLLLALRWTFAFLRFALLVRVVSSWIPGLAHRSWLAWSYPATEWMLRPLRGLIPAYGMMDLSPIVAYFGLRLVEWLVESVLLAGLGA